MPGRVHHHGGSQKETVNFAAWQALVPRPILRHVKHFEAAIEDAVERFAQSLPDGAWVLDGGAGEGQYKHFFKRQKYIGVDLGIGDKNWNYSTLDACADLGALPFADATFDAAISIVTLEHVCQPAQVIVEMARVLKPGGKLLLVAPHQWEEHQQPHDYYRYTRFGLRHLLEQARFEDLTITPVGGIFRLLSRRLLMSAGALPPGLNVLFLIWVAIPAVVLPILDPFDKLRNSTLGYICSARKPF